MIITIDGPAGTGKSTIAKKLSKLIDIPYYNTGTMYRAITYKAMRNHIQMEDAAQRKELLSKTTLQLAGDQCFLDRENVAQYLRDKQVDTLVAKISTYEDVRKYVLEIQRAVGKNGGIFEGRDMGTVVFPDADLKIFLTASPKVRAQRRFLEMKNIQPNITLAQVEKEIKERDHLDTTRKIAPLRQAEDAFFIDTSYLSVAEIISKIERQYKVIANRKDRPGKFFLFSRFLTKMFCKIFYRHKVYGKKNLIKGAAIVAANHVSYLDPIILGIASKAPIYFFARKTLFKQKLLGFLLSRLCTYPINQEGIDLRAMRATEALLQDRKKIGLFPEGARSFDGTLQELKEGVALIAIKTKTKVIPALIVGTYEIWPRKKKWPKLFGKTATIFGSPLDPKLWGMYEKKEAQAQMTKAIKTKLIELKEWYDKGAKGNPP
jgi:cytidylate kinase